jgi:hypothetical protein
LRAPGEGEGVEGGTRGGLGRGSRRRGRGVGRGRGFRRAAVAVAVVGGGGDENHGRARGGRGREGDRQRTVAKVFKKSKGISAAIRVISSRAGPVQPHGDPSAQLEIG